MIHQCTSNFLLQLNPIDNNKQNKIHLSNIYIADPVLNVVELFKKINNSISLKNEKKIFFYKKLKLCKNLSFSGLLFPKIILIFFLIIFIKLSIVITMYLKASLGVPSLFYLLLLISALCLRVTSFYYKNSP